MSDEPRRILIVEDDPGIADLLDNYLRAQGFATEVVGDGELAIAAAERVVPALMLLDLNLPGRDGLEVCREVRRFSAVPIIMLTARIEEVDRLIGLEVGADDYVCKPFSPREVVARIKAQLRRADGRVGPQVPEHGFRIDDSTMRIAWQDQWLALTAVEFRLLRKLLSRPRHVFSRNALLDSVHEAFRDTTDRAIDSHIKNLRRKIERVRTEGSGIVSVYGVGYRFDPDAAESPL